MAHIKVGVRRYAGGAPAERGDPKAAELQVHWLLIGDQLIDTKDAVILSTDYHADGHGISKVTVVFGCSSFETVDARDKPTTPTTASRADRLADVVAEAQPVRE